MPEGLVPAVESGNPNIVADDFLGQLLVVAAEKAAKNEAEQALKKGFVTREQTNMALQALGDDLEKRIVDKILESLGQKVSEQVVTTLEATPGLRKSTVMTPEDEFEADPVKYILKKSRTPELGGVEALTQPEKEIIWGLTFAALSQGMRDAEGEDE